MHRQIFRGVLIRCLCFTNITPYKCFFCMCACIHARSDRQDEVVYYDTFESADDITEDDSGEKEELHRLHASVRQLEARRGRIIAKRSYLRNKRVRASLLSSAKILFCTFRHISCTLCRRSACPTTPRNNTSVKRSTRAPYPSNCPR